MSIRRAAAGQVPSHTGCREVLVGLAASNHAFAAHTVARLDVCIGLPTGQRAAAQMARPTCHIDGQILRNAAALSAITGTPIRVDKIRQGGKVCSSDISLDPGSIVGGRYEADTGTAGSCTLMVQQSLPCLLFAPSSDQPMTSHVTLRGGTDAEMAPPIDYLVHVLTPTLRRLFALEGLQVQCARRGFFPKGGGQVDVTCPALAPGVALKAFDLTERGEVKAVHIRTFSAGRVAEQAARDMAAEASRLLTQRLARSLPTIHADVVRETRASAVGDGSGISIVAETTTGCLFGASSPVSRDTPAEAAVSHAVEELLNALECGACVDQWMQDQLIVFMGLAAGESRMLCGELTLHTRTAIEIVGKLLPDARFQTSTVVREGRQLYLVCCEGAGVRGRSVSAVAPAESAGIDR